MTTFVDTSAFFAALAEDDPAHDEAVRWLETVATEGQHLLTHSYVAIESTALVHTRLGIATARVFLEDVLPVCEIRFVDQALHERATVAYLAGLRRRSSFVDRVSFELMRAEGIQRAFAFDADFSREGFETVP
jgi:predicted nucleic acid-binding protein